MQSITTIKMAELQKKRDAYSSRNHDALAISGDGSRVHVAKRGQEVINLRLPARTSES